MYLCAVGKAILFKELAHIWGNCGEVNNLVTGDPRPESWWRVRRLGLKGNEFHKRSS